MQEQKFISRFPIMKITWLNNQLINSFLIMKKMGEKMPQTNINLDSRGLWGIISRQNERRTMINRKYSR